MKRILKVEKIVKEVLELHPETKKDDFRLIYKVFIRFNDNVKFLNFDYVMKNHKELGLPSFKSITRARRKIQETRKDLIDGATEIIRKDEEQPRYEEFSRS